MKEFVLFDVEYTTWEECEKYGYDQEKGQYREVIEIGAVVVDPENFDAKDTFLAYCKPQKNPILSDYCIEKTGITQDKIDLAESYPDALARFGAWVDGRKLVFWGNDDISLFETCDLANRGLPFDYGKFYSLKELLKKQGFSGISYQSSELPKLYGIIPVGKAHDSLSDTYNVLAVLQQMKERGEYQGLLNALIAG